MIRRQKPQEGSVKVTFALPDDGEAVFLVGDFNAWDTMSHPLKKRSNGTRSVSVALEAGQLVRFRYAKPDGTFFDDPDADGFEPNGFGQTHAVLAV